MTNAHVVQAAEAECSSIRHRAQRGCPLRRQYLPKCDRRRLINYLLHQRRLHAGGALKLFTFAIGKQCVGWLAGGWECAARLPLCGPGRMLVGETGPAGVDGGSCCLLRPTQWRCRRQDWSRDGRSTGCLLRATVCTERAVYTRLLLTELLSTRGAATCCLLVASRCLAPAQPGCPVPASQATVARPSAVEPADRCSGRPYL